MQKNEAFLYQRLSNEADHEHSRTAVSAKPSTPRDAATNTQPPNTSERFSPTTTDPAPCTPKPNAPKTIYFQTSSPSFSNATAIAVTRGKSPGRASSGLQNYGPPDTSGWPLRRAHRLRLYTPTVSNSKLLPT